MIGISRLRCIPGSPSATATARSIPPKHEGGAVELRPDELEVRAAGREGYAVASEAGELVALDVQLTEALRRRGLVREVVRQLQEARRAAGLAVSDRIVLCLSGLENLEAWYSEIAAEVLATHVVVGEGAGVAIPLDVEGRAARAWLSLARG